jgi:hypothetical protein
VCRQGIASAKAAAAAAEVTVLALGLGVEMEGEGRDRVNMTLPALQRALYEAVAPVAKKLIVVLVSAGGIDVDESKAAAILWAPYGGEEAGSGLVSVITPLALSRGCTSVWCTGPLTFVIDARRTCFLATSTLRLGCQRRGSSRRGRKR